MANINLTSTTGSGFLETDFDQLKDALQDGGVDVTLTTPTITGAARINASSTARGLYVVNTGTGESIYATNSGATNNVRIDQTNAVGNALYVNRTVNATDGSYYALDVADTNASSVAGTARVSNAGTGTNVSISQTGALASAASALLVNSTTPHVAGSSQAFVDIRNQHGSSTKDTLYLFNGGTGRGMFLDQNGNASALVIDGEETSTNVIQVDADVLGNASILRLETDSTTYTNTSSGVLFVNVSSASASGAGVQITNAGSGNALQISNTGGGHAVELNNGNIIEIKQACFNGVVDDGNSSTADTIDWTTGSIHKSTLTGNCTYTFTAPSGVSRVQLLMYTGSGSFAVTWPASVKWTGGTAPTITVTASKVDIATFLWDGTNYWGSITQNYSA